MDTIKTSAYPEEIKTRFLEPGKYTFGQPYVGYRVIFAPALKVLLDIWRLCA